jgi:hypothetical protein
MFTWNSGQQRIPTIGSDTSEPPTDSACLHLSRKPLSTIQPSDFRTPRETQEGNLNLSSGMIYPSCLSAPLNDHNLPEMIKLARLEADSKAKADGGPVGPRKVLPRVRASILALDTHAKIFEVGGHLTVVHSKCGGHSTQKAEDDISHFKEHISVCKGPYTSNGDKSSLLHGGPASTVHRTTAIPAEPSPLPCPGFSFEGLFGRDYKSLLNHEREQVTHKADVAGLRWLDPKEKSSVISLSCLEKSPSCQEPGNPVAIA